MSPLLLQDALRRGATSIPEEVVKRAIYVAAPLTQVGFSFSRDVLHASARSADFAYRNVLKPALATLLPLQFFSDAADDQTRFTQTQSKAAQLVKGKRGHRTQQRKLLKVHAALGSGAVAFSFEPEASSSPIAVHNLAHNLAILDNPNGFRVSMGLQSSML